MDELAIALEHRALSEELLKKSLIRLNHLLEIIYNGKFDTLQKYIEEII